MIDLFSSIPWELMAWSVAKTLFLIFGVVLPMVSYTVYAERRVSALIQDRIGPNRGSVRAGSRCGSGQCGPG